MRVQNIYSVRPQEWWKQPIQFCIAHMKGPACLIVTTGDYFAQWNLFPGWHRRVQVVSDWHFLSIGAGWCVHYSLLKMHCVGWLHIVHNTDVSNLNLNRARICVDVQEHTISRNTFTQIPIIAYSSADKTHCTLEYPSLWTTYCDSGRILQSKYLQTLASKTKTLHG